MHLRSCNAVTYSTAVASLCWFIKHPNFVSVNLAQLLLPGHRTWLLRSGNCALPAASYCGSGWRWWVKLESYEYTAIDYLVREALIDVLVACSAF
jgi:hypothetical protein